MRTALWVILSFAGCVVVAGVVLIITFFGFVEPVEVKIDQHAREQRRLDALLVEKQTAALSLNKTRAEYDQLVEELGDARLESDLYLASANLPPKLPFLIRGTASEASIPDFIERLKKHYARVDLMKTTPAEAGQVAFAVRIWR